MANILVIDDDQDIATTTAMMLKDAGHTVNIELDEHSAVAAVTKYNPDLIVLDVMFPNNPEAGFELARLINAKWQKLPIIMITSVNQYSSIKFSTKDKDATWLPINEFVEKPVKKDILLKLVNKLLAV